MYYFPNEIKRFIDKEEYIQNEIGMSDSDVLVFRSFVLKIQERTVETDNERDIIEWLNGSIPVPQILAYCIEDNKAYTLMSKINGKMLCDEDFLKNPSKLIKIVAEALKLLWSVNVTGCELKASRLEERLKVARWNLENNLVDVKDAEPETFGKDGFANPKELLTWLVQNRPNEELVLSHGDFCLPNILYDEDKLAGFIDLGKMGPADRWQDLAIVLRSLRHNFAGKYNQGKSYFDFDSQMLLDELGMEMDERKLKYYLLLDELF